MQIARVFIIYLLIYLIPLWPIIGYANPPSSLTVEGKDEGGKARLQDSYGRLPLSFEVNQGQTDSQVKFLSRGSGYSLFLTPNEAVLALKKVEAKVKVEGKVEEIKNPLAPVSGGEGRGEGAVLRMKLLGANPTPQIAGIDELTGKSNYFVGNDPKKWQTNILNYAKVKYENIYPGIDLVYYGNQRQLEYDFIVAPGEDPNKIIFGFDGAEKIEIDDQGYLVLQADGSEVRMKRPYIYQEIDGKRVEVEGRFKIHGSKDLGVEIVGAALRGRPDAGPHARPELKMHPQKKGQPHRVAPTRTLEPWNPAYIYGFEVAAYDVSKPLIIDPVLVYSTYLGGSGSDSGADIAVDPAGNAYVIGVTNSIDFPTTLGAFDTTHNPSGQSTFSILNQDIFVAKLNPTGSALVYSTYLGSSSLDSGNGIAVDSFGNAYVTGNTFLIFFGSKGNNDFPTTPGAFDTTFNGGQDVFVARLDPTGSSLVYSTYLGSGQGGGIAVDNSGNAYMTGGAFFGFPVTPGAFDTTSGAGGFIAKINPEGSALVYSTYLRGGTGAELGDIAIDSDGNAYVTGTTSSTDLPIKNAFQPAKAGCEDAFVTKLNPTGSDLVYSTYLGGSNDFCLERGLGIAVDSVGSAYVTGLTHSTSFPTKNALQPIINGDGNDFFTDAFVAKLDSTGSSLIYSTYLGGHASEEGGKDIAVDSSGNVYVTGTTFSDNFPLVNPLQPIFGGDRDAFVTKINPEGSALIYSTFLGGNISDHGVGIAVDLSGSAHVTGSTNSGTGISITEGSFDATLNGVDAFIAKISDQPSAIEVAIDIKPGSFPNSINLGSKGTTPVAIFSDTGFDAATVDPLTVTLASASVALKKNGTPMSSFEDVNGDGFLDLVVHLNTKDLQLSPADTEAVLEGQTFDGSAITGTDSVNIVP